ncbi:transposase, partial [Sansalvadorimonas sp. 2012CJ34-2]
PERSLGVALVLPSVNSQGMGLHLKEISKVTPAGRHAIVIMDRAGYHLEKELPDYSNLTPVHLPPYSPELNSAEQLWEWLREHDLSNRCFDGYEDIVDACCNA